jgi:hypothetical protein
MFENHMELLHPGSYSSPQLAILSESMRRPATRVFQHCPLCNYVPEIQQNTVVNRKAQAHFANTDNLHKHVAAHLEALALLSLPWQNDMGEGSSSMDSPLEKRSTLKNGAVKGLDDVSLTFDDPPKLDPLGDEQNELNNLLQPKVPAVISREAEWGFVPSLPYDGHSQDRVLQNLLRKHLASQVEKMGTGRKIEPETGVSTEGKYFKGNPMLKYKANGTQLRCKRSATGFPQWISQQRMSAYRPRDRKEHAIGSSRVLPLRILLAIEGRLCGL